MVRYEFLMLGKWAKMGHNGPKWAAMGQKGHDFWGPKFEENLNIYRQITWSYTHRLPFHYIWG